MKKGLVSGAIMFAALAVMLGGCGDGDDAESVGVVQQITGEPLLSETEQSILNYEQRYSSGTLTAEEYRALAELYRQEGRIREQRDMLEQSWRLYQDTEAFDALQGITVNLAEEDAAIREQGEILYQAFELPEYLDDGVNALISEGWFSVMMPKLREGKRSYFLQSDPAQPALYMEAGYGESGAPYASAWFVKGDGSISYLHKTGSVVWRLDTGLADGKYQGNYESWLCIGSSGDIIHEKGSFEQGLLTGDYTAQVHSGTASADLYTLWSNREGMEFVNYSGKFEEGHTTVEQPSEASRRKLLGESASGDLLVYACDEKQENYLFMTVEGTADPAAAVFDAAAMGLAGYPGFTFYEAPAEEADDNGNPDGTDGSADSSAGTAEGAGTAQDSNSLQGGTSGQETGIQIRIYDSEIQWLSGTKWISLGTVESFRQQDPFLAYSEMKASADAAYAGQAQNGIEGEGIPLGGGMLTDRLNRMGAGKIEKESPKENTGSKTPPKQNTKPSAPTKPPVPNTEPSAPAQQPDQPQDNGGGNDSGGGDNGGGNDTGGDNGGGNDSGGGDNGGGNDSGGGDTGGNNGGGNDTGGNGGDVDIEWTDDIM